jgi:hypothetical protein
MLVSIVINWLLGILIDRHEPGGKRKLFLVIAVTYDVSLLFVFKYVSFIA